MIERRNAVPERRLITTYDLEWVPKSYQLLVAGAYDELHGYRAYYSIPDFLAGELIRPHVGRRYYAHFGGGADMLFILPALHELGYRVDTAFSGSSAVIVKVRRGHDHWTFLDSFFTLRTSLAEIGQAIGRAKPVVDDFAHASPGEVRDRNEADCLILYEALHRAEDTLLELGGELQSTISATAMDLFQRRYLTTTIETSEAINRVAMLAYHGGRVEIVRPRCRHGYSFDINSSFAHAMARRPVPGSPQAPRRSLPADDTPYLAHLTVTVPQDCWLPPLPYHHGESVYYPTGTWSNWFMTPHVEALELAGGKIERVEKVIPFAPCWDMKAYADDIYARRKRATPGGYDALFYKFMLTNLYGKTGEGILKQKLLFNPRTLPPCPFNRENDPDVCDGCVKDCPREFLQPGMWLVSGETFVPHRHPAIAATITADANLRLLELMRETERKGSLYYVDTDNAVGSRLLPTSRELGGLKLEAVIRPAPRPNPRDPDSKYGMVALRPKLYRRGRTVKAKGFHGSHGPKHRELSPTQFKRLQQGRCVRDTHMGRVRELLRSGIRPRDITTLKRLHEAAYFPKRARWGTNSTRPWTVAEINQR